jgi:hypothetical protein
LIAKRRKCWLVGGDWGDLKNRRPNQGSGIDTSEHGKQNTPLSRDSESPPSHGAFVMPAYSGKAQPFLDAIAVNVFSAQDVRDWLIRGTPVETQYTGSSVLTEEQRAVRWRSRQTVQPFWANYHCGRDSRCTCRIAGSKGLESDAIFFFRNASRRVLAVHVEFKHPKEAFRFGQPEAYPLRAACFTKTYAQRRTVNPHHDWATVIFCGAEAASDPRLSNFQRVITHNEVAGVIKAYPYPRLC